MTTARELITGSLRLLNVVRANQTPQPQDVDIALESLNGLIESKSNDLLDIHTFTPVPFALVPGKQSYNLGPATDDYGNPTYADWVTERPMRIIQANLLLNSVIVQANFSIDTKTPTLGATSVFTDQSIGATSWLWHFGDGSTSTLQNPTHTYANPGVYVVTLTITNGIYSSTATGEVVPVPDYVVRFHIYSSTGQQGINVVDYNDTFMSTPSTITAPNIAITRSSLSTVFPAAIQEWYMVIDGVGIIPATPPGLFISSTGGGLYGTTPLGAIPAGQTITHTISYTNTTGTTANDCEVVIPAKQFDSLYITSCTWTNPGNFVVNYSVGSGVLTTWTTQLVTTVVGSTYTMTLSITRQT